NDDDDERAFDDDYDDDDTNFVFAHGRRYHASNGGRAFYPLPNDELEQERDDMKHNLALWMMHDKLFYAPVDEALRRGGAVFDLGTGTGTWAMELAKIYTTSQIHGCDLSPIQPAYVWDNVFFATGDFEDAATWDEYPDGAFDYIHMRYTLFAVQDPAALIQRAWKYLKPGGYLEFQEVLYWPQADDNTLSPETPYAFRDFCYYMQQALARLTSPGMDLFAINRVAELMRTPPPPPLFNDITEVRHKLPIGRWPASRRQREKGIWFLRMVILEGLGAIAKRAFVTGLGWTEVQVEMFLFEVRRSLLEWDGVHAYLPFTVVYGRKPLEDGSAAVGGHDVVMGGA
ncbi:S-adenosyl-L-methionine-dependent methyltransferase, partial [Coniella lustricola]